MTKLNQMARCAILLNNEGLVRGRLRVDRQICPRWPGFRIFQPKAYMNISKFILLLVCCPFRGQFEEVNLTARNCKILQNWLHLAF